MQRLRTGAVKAHELRTFGKAELTAQLAELRTELQAVSTVIVYCFKLLVVVLGIEWQVLTDGKCKHCRTSILGQKKVAWVLVCCTVSVRWPWGVDPIGSSRNGWIGSHRSGSNPIQSNPIQSDPTQHNRSGSDRIGARVIRASCGTSGRLVLAWLSFLCPFSACLKGVASLPSPAALPRGLRQQRSCHVRPRRARCLRQRVNKYIYPRLLWYFRVLCCVFTFYPMIS